MASRRDEKQNVNLGDRRIIWQIESNQSQRGRLGITLHKNRQAINRLVLGKINHSRFLQGRNAGTLLTTPANKSSLGVLQDYKVGEITISCNNKGAFDCSSYQLRRIKPSAKCADIRRSFRSTKLGLSGQWKTELRARVRPYGLLSTMAPNDNRSTTNELCMWHPSEEINTTAIRVGYHNRPTQMLPREDVALIK